MKNPAAVSLGPTGSMISGREPYGEEIHIQSLYRSVVGRNRIRDRAPGRRNDRGRRATAPLAVAGLDSGDHEAIGGKDSIAKNAGLLDVRDGAPVAPDQFPQRVEQLSVKVSPLVRILEIGSVPPVTGWSDIGVQVPKRHRDAWWSVVVTRTSVSSKEKHQLSRRPRPPPARSS